MEKQDNNQEFHNTESFESQRAVNEEMYNRGSWSDVMNGGASVEYRAPVPPKKKKRNKLTKKQKWALGFGILVFFMVLSSILGDEEEVSEPQEVQTQERQARNGFDDETNKIVEFDGYQISIPKYFSDDTSTESEGLNFSTELEDMSFAIATMNLNEVGITAENITGRQEEIEPELAKRLFATIQENASSDPEEDYYRYSTMKTIDYSYKIYVMNITAEEGDERADGALYAVFDWEKNMAIISLFLQDCSSNFDYSGDALKVMKSIKRSN